MTIERRIRRALIALSVFAVGVTAPALALERLGPEWRVSREGLVQGVPWICITNGAEMRCGPSLTPPPGQDWSLAVQAVCDVGGNKCEPWAPSPPPIIYAPPPIYLPPPPVYVSPWLEGARGMQEGLQQPPPSIQCHTQRNGGRAWDTTCR